MACRAEWRDTVSVPLLLPFQLTLACALSLASHVLYLYFMPFLPLGCFLLFS